MFVANAFISPFKTQTMHIKSLYTQQHCYVSQQTLYPGGIRTQGLTFYIDFQLQHFPVPEFGWFDTMFNARLMLGAVPNATADPSAFPFHGSLSCLQVHDSISAIFGSNQ
jgi:hypothetical protein